MVIPTLKLDQIKKEPTNSQDTLALSNYSQINKTDQK